MTRYIIRSTSGKLGCLTYRTIDGGWSRCPGNAYRFYTRPTAEAQLMRCNPRRKPEIVEVES